MDFDILWKLFLGLFVAWVLNQSVPPSMPPRYNYYDSTKVETTPRLLDECNHESPYCVHPIGLYKFNDPMPYYYLDSTGHIQVKYQK